MDSNVTKISPLMTFYEWELLCGAYVIFHSERGENDLARMWAEKLGPRYQMKFDF